MTTLIDFLEARLAEDEAAAQKAAAVSSPRWIDNGSLLMCLDDSPTPFAEPLASVENYRQDDALIHAARHDPARVLREVQAKRRIIEAHAENNRQDHPHDCIRRAWYERESFCWVIRQMAAAYNDHTDYEPEWDPEAWPEWVPLGHAAGDHEETP